MQALPRWNQLNKPPLTKEEASKLHNLQDRHRDLRMLVNKSSTTVLYDSTVVLYGCNMITIARLLYVTPFDGYLCFVSPPQPVTTDHFVCRYNLKPDIPHQVFAVYTSVACVIVPLILYPLSLCISCSEYKIYITKQEFVTDPSETRPIIGSHSLYWLSNSLKNSMKVYQEALSASCE